MSQQGGRPARPEDDWWGQLYDDSTEDAGPAVAPDTLDDRFASAKHTVTPRPTPPPPPEPPPDAWEDAWDAAWAKDPDADTGAERGATAEADAIAEAGKGAVGGVGAAGHGDGDPRRAVSDRPVVPPQRITDTPPSPPPPPPPPPLAPAPPPPIAATDAPPGARIPWEPSALPEPSAPPPSAIDYVGSGPPTYDPEPTALPGADPDELGELVADTVLDGARYGACTLRAVSLRGDSARYRGEPRRDSLLTARFGTGRQALLLVAMATGVRGTPGAHLAAAEACRWIGRAVGRSHHRLVEDIRAARRGELKSGLHRLTDRSLGNLRASAVEQGVGPQEYTASLRCLLLPADPDCRTRVFFGVGDGGLFRLRDGAWQDIEPLAVSDEAAGPPVVGSGSPPGTVRAETPEGDRFTMDLGIPTPPSPYEPAPQPPPAPFRFRASVARPGDALVMCTGGLADPLRGEAALCAYLARRWSGPTPPGLAAFLADAQVRVKGYADDRTAAAVWEA
ncbi:protein phosphatase 2C domain-containing protein [Streptomyces yokosukanensis]|uniref:protein phosphatase 2C domain-containing protein n=1 Tax=Streptomyces yokosukanensis TaxID=67386 RepID=UPI003431E9E4